MWIYDPFEEFEEIRRRMERLMRRMLRVEEEIYQPVPIEISETQDELIIRADLPGFSKEEISLHLTEDTLEIEARHKEKKVEKTEKLIRSERKYGAVRRLITLPLPVDPETATAKFEHGVLEIKAKKKVKQKGRKLEIQ